MLLAYPFPGCILNTNMNSKTVHEVSGEGKDSIGRHARGPSRQILAKIFLLFLHALKCHGQLD